MKYLNNNNLFFVVGDIDPALVPTNANQEYIIQVTKHSDPSTVLKEYHGQIFFYSLMQKIFYDFLVDMMIDGSFSLPMANDVNLIPIVDVTITVGSYSQTETVARLYKPSWLSDAEYQTLINPTEQGMLGWGMRFYGKGLTDLKKYPMAKVAIGMQYPVVCYTGDMTLYAATDNFSFISNRIIRSIPMIENGLYYCNIEDYTELQAAMATNSRQTTKMDTLPMEYECNAPYILQWYDPIGFFQSQPFYGSESESYAHNTITNLQGEESKYQTQEKRKWKLQSELVIDQRMFPSLFTSPVIYLYDVKLQVYFRVLIENTDYNYTRSKKPFRFAVTLQEHKSLIYR